MKRIKNGQLASALTAAAAISLVLAGCSGADAQSNDQSGDQSGNQAQSGGSAASAVTEPPEVDRNPSGDLPKITLGEDGKAPTMEPAAGDPPAVISVKTLEEGDGDTVTPDDFVTVDYIGFLWDGTEFDSSYSRGQAATFSLDGVIQGWKWGLADTRVGDTVMVVVPPEFGYGQVANGAIPADSTLVFVVKVRGAVSVSTEELAEAEPTDEELPTGLSITGDPGQEPQINFAADVAAPTGSEPLTIVLNKGKGAIITEGDTVAYNLVGSTWGSPEQVSYWDLGPQSTLASGTTLLGQTVGSRLALISPGDGQSAEAQVVVVDILAAIGSETSDSSK